MESKKSPEVEGWELCESESEPPPQLPSSGENMVGHGMAEEKVISELREEITLLKKTMAVMQSDLETQLSKANVQPLYSDITSAASSSTQEQQTSLNQQDPKLNTVKQENVSAIKPNTSTGKEGKPHEASVWAITNLGEIFVNEKTVNGSESTQLKANTHMQEMNFTGTSTPVIIPLDMGCFPGTEILITGCIEEDAKRMHINLDSEPMHTRKKRFESRNINFHFNPRFDNDRGVVVRNTMTHGEWGHEERQGEMPFELGSEFALKIVCCFDGYMVYVDDQLYCTYKHRLSPYAVTAVSIWRDVTLYKVIIKNVKPELNPNDMLWQQLGGHLKSIESCHAGVTWGISYDHTLWVYNGGWGGSFFGNLCNCNVNSMTDHEDHYVYESQRWNAITGYTSSGLITDSGAWNIETNKEKSAQDLVKLLSMDWQWISDWKIDFQLPGIDSEGWQYVANKSTRLCNKTHENYMRKRQWHRRCAITTTGPWVELKDTKLLDVSLAPLDDTKSDSVVIVWAVTCDGHSLVRNAVSQSNPMGTTWECISSDQPFISISCGPYNCVWAIAKDGDAYRRVGINRENLLGDSWACVNFPISVPLSQVSVGKLGVWAADSCGKLYVRKGITCDLPEGGHWQCIMTDHFITDSAKENISFKQVSVGQTEVWAITDTGIAKKRLGVGPDNPAGVGWSTGPPGVWQYLTVRAL